MKVLMMNQDGTTTELDHIPEGAVQVHWGSFESNLNLSVKESVERVKERAESFAEYWCDPEYGDSKLPEEHEKIVEMYLQQVGRSLC